MIAKSEAGLQKIMDGLNSTSLEYGMKINIKKTKVMKVSKVGGKENIRKLEAMEMCLWRRMEKISWKDRISNEVVLRRVGVERELITMLRSRKKSWIGHVLRGDERSNRGTNGRE